MESAIYLKGIEVAELKNFIIEAINESKESQKEQPVNQRYLTRHEVAELLGVHVVTVDNYRKAGKLVFSRLDRALRISEADVQEFLDNHKTAI